MPTDEEPAALDAAPTSSRPVPDAIDTPHGPITRYGDAYAIRNSDHPEVMKGACRGRGKWVPEYRNWLIAENEIGVAVADIATRADRAS